MDEYLAKVREAHSDLFNLTLKAMTLKANEEDLAELREKETKFEAQLSQLKENSGKIANQLKLFLSMELDAWEELPSVDTINKEYADKLRIILQDNETSQRQIGQDLDNIRSKKSELEKERKIWEDLKASSWETHLQLMKEIEAVAARRQKIPSGKADATNNQSQVSASNQSTIKAAIAVKNADKPEEPVEEESVNLVYEKPGKPDEKDPEVPVVTANIDPEVSVQDVELNESNISFDVAPTKDYSKKSLADEKSVKEPPGSGLVQPTVDSIEPTKETEVYHNISTTADGERNKNLLAMLDKASASFAEVRPSVTPATAEAMRLLFGDGATADDDVDDPYSSGPPPQKKAKTFLEACENLTEDQKDEISNFYLLDPKPSPDLLRAFASDRGIDLEILEKWNSEENGDSLPSGESTADCSFNSDENIELVLSQDETRPVVYGCSLCSVTRNAEDSQDRLLTIRYLNENADISSPEFQSCFIAGLPKFTKLTLHKRPKPTKGKVAHVLFENSLAAKTYVKKLEERPFKTKRLILAISAYSEQTENEVNRRTSDENLEIEEVVSSIQDGNYKMRLIQAAKVIHPSEDVLGSVIKPKKRGRPLGSSSQCKRVKN